MKQNFIIFLLLYSYNYSFSQNWDRIYGLNGRSEIFRHAAESYDRGFIILGGFHYYPNTRGWVIKTDVNGNPLYELSIGTGTGLSQGNYPSFIEPTTDGGMIICGSHDRWTVNDIGITKLDACGNLEWCKIWRTDGMPDWGIEIRQLPDGGYIMLTIQYNCIEDSTSTHLFRFDQDGNVLWIQPYVTPPSYIYVDGEVAYDLLITNKGDYFMGGRCYVCDSVWDCRLKCMALLADSGRQEQWVTIYRDTLKTEYSSGRYATQKGSGNVYLGAGYNGPNNTYPLMLLVLDSLGNIVYETLPQVPDIGDKWAEGFLGEPMFTVDGRMFAHTLMVDSTNYYPGWFSLHEFDSLGNWYNTFLHPNAHYGARTIM